MSKKFERTSLDLSKCAPAELIMMVDLDRCIACGPWTAITNSIAVAIPVQSEEGLKDLSSWLLADKFAGQNEGLHSPEKDMAQYLKDSS